MALLLVNNPDSDLYSNFLFENWSCGLLEKDVLEQLGESFEHWLLHCSLQSCRNYIPCRCPAALSVIFSRSAENR